MISQGTADTRKLSGPKASLAQDMFQLSSVHEHRDGVRQLRSLIPAQSVHPTEYIIKAAIRKRRRKCQLALLGIFHVSHICARQQPRLLRLDEGVQALEKAQHGSTVLFVVKPESFCIEVLKRLWNVQCQRRLSILEDDSGHRTRRRQYSRPQDRCLAGGQTDGDRCFLDMVKPTSENHSPRIFSMAYHLEWLPFQELGWRRIPQNAQLSRGSAFTH
mmetsp:Transcript_66864/g.178765  ORF Transcript_66864/g.178765 Transcript_66864/m.178765 type:complete len:217 (-) Transcript_66864:1151-1801(-)